MRPTKLLTAGFPGYMSDMFMWHAVSQDTLPSPSPIPCLIQYFITVDITFNIAVVPAGTFVLTVVLLFIFFHRF